MRISSVLAAAVFALGVAALNTDRANTAGTSEDQESKNLGQPGNGAAIDEKGSPVGVVHTATVTREGSEPSVATITFTSFTSGPKATPTANVKDSDSDSDEDENIEDSSPMSSHQHSEYQDDGKKSSDPNTAAIVGGIVGGLFGVALLGLIFWFAARRRKKQHNIQQRSRALINLDKAQPNTPSPTPGITDAPLPPVPTDRNSTGVGGAAGKQELQQGPVELQSREVDPDGVSVRSFDLEEGRQGRNHGEVPRLPIYGGGNAGL